MIETIMPSPDAGAEQGLRIDIDSQAAKTRGSCTPATKANLSADVASAPGQRSVVAGAGFEPVTFRL